MIKNGWKTYTDANVSSFRPHYKLVRDNRQGKIQFLFFVYITILIFLVYQIFPWLQYTILTPLLNAVK